MLMSLYVIGVIRISYFCGGRFVTYVYIHIDTYMYFWKVHMVEVPFESLSVFFWGTLPTL